MTGQNGRQQQGPGQIMFLHAERLAVILCPLLLVAACASGQQHTTQLLGDRLQQHLSPDIAAGRAALQPLSDGARVTLVDPNLFQNGGNELNDNGRGILASVTEGLLDPSLLQISVDDTSPITGPVGWQPTRAQAVNQFFTDYGLGGTLQPPPPPEPMPVGAVAPAPAGVAITISLQCGNRHQPPGYSGNGERIPVCD
jgi:hypothetical protein